VKTPVMIAPEALDFSQLLRTGETIGWAEATAEPVFLTRMLDAQAERCPPFRVFFALTFSEALAAGHTSVTVTALGGASAGRRFFAGGADNVVPAGVRISPPIGWSAMRCCGRGCTMNYNTISAQRVAGSDAGRERK
jgi:hypothetical protein